MKKSLSIILLLVLCMLPLSGCKENGGNIPGGYTADRSLTDDDLDIFSEALGDDFENYTPEKVSTQVVAGTNYRFLAKDLDGGYVHIVVFVPLGEDPAPTVSEITAVDG